MKSKWRDRVTVSNTLYERREAFYAKLLSVVLDTNDYDDQTRNTVNGYVRSRRFDLLLSFADSLGRTEYSTARDHYLANQLAALIKKVPRDLRSFGIDPEKAALEKFYNAERRCRRYNLIFSLENKLGRRRSSHLRELSRRWIRKVLGSTPVFKDIWNKCDFGPGASVGVSGNATHLASKLLAPSWSVTPTALPYALAALRSNPQMWELLLNKENVRHFSWDPDLFEKALTDKVVMVDYNKVTLVPKTAKVHRTIAVEPLLNGYIQKGVDVLMRQKLFRYGIDLKDQSRNQRLARIGSISVDDPFVTIDLSEASDSISRGLARDLLPPAWFHFLNAIRSPSYLLNGVVKPYEKFCSMGNGFCFPLETLIFSSVCEAVYEYHSLKTDYSVYGDDIIVRSSVASDVLKLLRCLGFRHNPDKTFLEGPFRESCGADWYFGEDVRPVTMNDIPGSLQEYYSFHNQTLRNERSTAYFAEARSYIRSCVPPKYRFVRPFKGNTDTAFEVEHDLFMSSPFAFWNRETWSWKWTELITFSPPSRGFSEKAGYHAALLQAALRGANSEAPFTDRRNTRTRVTLISHHGGSSTLLPSDFRDAFRKVKKLVEPAV